MMIPSLRDPAGCLFAHNGRILRAISREAAPAFQAFHSSSLAQTLASRGQIARTTVLRAAEVEALLADPEVERPCREADIGMVVEHEAVPFPSFPYEWPPEMLHAAACLTLDLAEKLLPEGMGLKDATPYNVLFRGPHPVFVDLLSVERRDPLDPTWLPYAQFVRTFLLPLLLNKYLGVPIAQSLTTRRDGIEPEEAYRLCGPLRKLLPPFLGLVSIPVWLGARQDPDSRAVYRKKSAGDPERARFILRCLFRQVRRTLDKLAPESGRKSPWSRYMVSDHNYTPEQFNEKQAFIEEALKQVRAGRVLDIGCNTGHFSLMAARAGASVVATDSDPVVVGELWRAARQEQLDVLPLVVDITRPSAAIGWRNRECAPFLDRARGGFDLVLMLALLHHLLVGERIPLTEVIDLAAELTTRFLIIEFIAPDDSMFRRIARGRDQLFKGFTRDAFESAFVNRFKPVRSCRLGESSRWLYLLEKQ
jgi:SAM-dependent methyltransferase